MVQAHQSSNEDYDNSTANLPNHQSPGSFTNAHISEHGIPAAYTLSLAGATLLECLEYGKLGIILYCIVSAPLLISSFNEA